MAIINSVAFGKARKTAGNIVFYDRLGQTVARQKNLTPTNPNTYAQVAQRILITNPSRVYRSIVEATRSQFGAKFFDYSFGRNYLATKRRTAYNEFFFRAMLKLNPVFFTKSAAVNRAVGLPIDYELSQGSLQTPAYAEPIALHLTEPAFAATGATASPSYPDMITAFAAQNGYVIDSNFKALVIAFFYKPSAVSDPELVTRCGLIYGDQDGEPRWDALDSGLDLISDVNKMAILTAGVIAADASLIFAGSAIVPFAIVAGVATSANVSIRIPSTGEAADKIASMTTDLTAKHAAIMSYGPSTPAPTRFA